MRHARASFRIAAFLTAVTVLACAGGEKDAGTADTSASAAAAAPPPPESFAITADDGSWSADISPSAIVFRQRNDSVVFPYAPYTGSSALREYSSVMTAGADTVRITVNMAMTSCSDKAGKQYTHQVQLWLTGDKKLESRGCGTQK